MRRAWSYARLLTLAVLMEDVSAGHSNHYQIHRIDKQYDALRKRDGVCSSPYTACPAVQGGGCCPDNYACQSTYCYATTAGPVTGCGRVGYFQCGSDKPGRQLSSRASISCHDTDISDTGLCCPTGNVCGQNNGCTPAVGETYSHDCPNNYYLCPSSLMYGCCMSGMGCASNGCYSTAPSTATVTSVVTTTDANGDATTSVMSRTMVITPAPATAVNLDASGVVPKLIASTVPKISPVQTATASDSGLSPAAMGGIIGGVIAVVLVVIIAAFLIIRRLRHTEKVVEESKQGSSGRRSTATHKQGFGPPTVSEVEVDPLTQTTTSPRQSHLRAHSDPSVTYARGRSPSHSVELSSERDAPPAWPGHYNPIPHADHDNTQYQNSDAQGGPHDAARFSQQSQGSYRMSYDSQGNWRQGRWSNVSEVSGSADGAHGSSELDAVDASAQRRSSSSARPPPGPLNRKYSGSGGEYHQRVRSDSSVPGTSTLPLGTVNEVAELHGYYGPQDRQTGQTDARPGSNGT